MREEGGNGSCRAHTHLCVGVCLEHLSLQVQLPWTHSTGLCITNRAKCKSNKFAQTSVQSTLRLVHITPTTELLNNIFRILQLWSAEVNILRTNQTLIGIVYRKLFHQHPATSNQLHHQVNQQSDHNFVSFSILNEIPSRLVSCISVGASGCWKAWHQINSLVQWNRATKLWFTSIDERLCQGSTYLHRSPIEWRYCRQPKIDASRVSRYITGLNATPTIFEPHCQQIDLFVSFLSFSNLWTSHYWLTIR